MGSTFTRLPLSMGSTGPPRMLITDGLPGRTARAAFVPSVMMFVC